MQANALAPERELQSPHQHTRTSELLKFLWPRRGFHEHLNRERRSLNDPTTSFKTQTHGSLFGIHTMPSFILSFKPERSSTSADIDMSAYNDIIRWHHQLFWTLMSNPSLTNVNSERMPVTLYSVSHKVNWRGGTGKMNRSYTHVFNVGLLSLNRLERRSRLTH